MPQPTAAMNSEAHRPIAIRPKIGGAPRCGSSRKATKVKYNVTAITIAMRCMVARSAKGRNPQPEREESRSDDRMRRLIALLAASLIVAPSAQAKTWNAAEQQSVADAGVLPRLADGHFHGERNLTAAQLSQALGEAASTSGATVSVTAFDARLVEHLGLTDVAQHVQQAAAQLHPPRYFG